MAEVADILSRPNQTGDPAGPERRLFDGRHGQSEPRSSVLARDRPRSSTRTKTITPITYINSAADLKAFCGEHGGIVCTSSNARQILEWASRPREKVLFFPDQHLGRWTGYLMDIPLSEMLVWDPDLPLGGLTPQQIKMAKVLLWKGTARCTRCSRPSTSCAGAAASERAW
jgi:quinolinate synthase